MFTISTQKFVEMRAVARLVVLILCLGMLSPLAWRTECSAAFGTEIFGHTSNARPVLGRKMQGGHLPATLTEAPSIAPRTGLGRQAPRGPLPDTSKQMYAALTAVPHLPSLRIDPLVGDIVIPSFLLPSERGLIFFAIPPPSVP